MSDAQTLGSDEAANDKRDNRLELLAAIVLGIAALLTAFATFQAGKKGGEALQGYSESSAQLSDANQFYNQGGQTSALDQSLFVEYAIAQTEGNTDVADYLRGTLMRPELSEAIDWFDANDEAETPFDDAEDNPYTIEDYETANDLEEQSRETFEQGSAADDEGDQYEMANVLFAIALFAAGIATVFRRADLQKLLIGGGAVAVLIGLAIVGSALA